MLTVGNKSEPRVSSDHASLFHYTSEGGLYGILQSQELWATHYEYLNDREEFRTARSILVERIKPAVQEVFEALIADGTMQLPEGVKIGDIVNADADSLVDTVFQVTFRLALPFVFSFCTHDEGSDTHSDGLLSQWRGYGPRGGYALEFGTAKIEAMLEEDGQLNTHSGYGLGEVIYTVESPSFLEVESKIDKIVSIAEPMFLSFVRDDIDPRPQVDEAYLPFIEIASRMKNAGFAEENEVRLVHMVPDKVPDNKKPSKHIEFREQREERVPYIKLLSDCGNLPIKRVLVGPHPQASIRAKTLELFRNVNSLDFAIDVSRIPYLPA